MYVEAGAQEARHMLVMMASIPESETDAEMLALGEKYLDAVVDAHLLQVWHATYRHHMKNDEIASIMAVSDRTVRRWRREAKQIIVRRDELHHHGVVRTQISICRNGEEENVFDDTLHRVFKAMGFLKKDR